MRKSYYEILGVSNLSTYRDIKKSYRKLVIKYHPDRNGDTDYNNTKIKEINQAYECLSDTKKRADYDRKLNTEFFKQTFSFSQTSHQNHIEKAYEVKITLEESYFGCKKTLNVLNRQGDDTYYVVEIPRGVDHGHTLKVEGNSRVPGFFIMIQISEHSFFQRRDHDLLCTVTVPYIVTIVGGKTTIPWLDGTKRGYYFDPRNTQPGIPVVLQGWGMPVPGTNHYGDLYISFNVRGTVDLASVLQESVG